MALTVAKLLSHSDSARNCFSRQGVLFVVAIALFAVLWVTKVRGPGTDFVPVLLYTLSGVDSRGSFKGLLIRRPFILCLPRF
jgi:hypothetical protein